MSCQPVRRWTMISIATLSAAAVAAPAEPGQPTKQSGRAKKPRIRRVWVLEDDHTQAMTYREAFGRLGVSCRLFAHSQDPTAVLAEFGRALTEEPRERPQMILTDGLLGGWQDVCKAGDGYGIRVFVASGEPLAEQVAKYPNAHFLPKPIELAVLANLLETDRVDTEHH